MKDQKSTCGKETTLTKRDSAFILESGKAPTISVLPQNTGELVHFFPKIVTFKGTLKSYFYFLGLPSSIGDDLNFELKHSQHPRLQQKTTAKKHQAVKRGKIIGGKITVKSSLNKRRSQMLQKQKLKWCYPEPGDTKWLHLQPRLRTGGQDVN